MVKPLINMKFFGKNSLVVLWTKIIQSPIATLTCLKKTCRRGPILTLIIFPLLMVPPTLSSLSLILILLKVVLNLIVIKHPPLTTVKKLPSDPHRFRVVLLIVLTPCLMRVAVPRRVTVLHVVPLIILSKKPVIVLKFHIGTISLNTLLAGKIQVTLLSPVFLMMINPKSRLKIPLLLVLLSSQERMKKWSKQKLKWMKVTFG